VHEELQWKYTRLKWWLKRHGLPENLQNALYLWPLHNTGTSWLQNKNANRRNVPLVCIKTYLLRSCRPVIYRRLKRFWHNLSSVAVSARGTADHENLHRECWVVRPKCENNDAKEREAAILRTVVTQPSVTPARVCTGRMSEVSSGRCLLCLFF
jgi:hypothetical protein